MEIGHKEKILSNIDQLMRATDYDKLIEFCLEKNILSQTMRDNLEEEFGNEMDRKIALWRKIPKRGPKAYGKLLEICSMHYPGAYRILCNATGKNFGQVASVSQSLSVLDEPDMNLGAVGWDGPCLSTFAKQSRPMPELTPYAGPLVNHLNLTVTKSMAIHTNAKIKSYKMCSRERGILFLINIINFKNPKLNRLGANYDRDNLIYLFNELGFTIYYYEDIHPDEMFNLIESVITTCDNIECFVFGIMTHGNIRNHSPYVEFGNGHIISLDLILEKFYNQNCYTLAMKPKIFLLPFCRGNQPDQGVFVPNIQTDTSIFLHDDVGQPSPLVKLSSKSDILICYATVKGFESHRNMDRGSWYIQALCEVWADNAHDTDVETMMKMVDTKMREQWAHGDTTHTVQTAGMENLGFNKALFLNPGFYLD